MYGIELFTRSPTKLIITYCDRVSHVDKSARITKSMYKYPIKCQHCNDRAQLQFFIHNSKFLSIYRTVVIVSDFYWPKTIPASFGIAATTRHQELSLVESFGKYDCGTRSTSTLATSSLILFTPSLKRPPLAIAVYISSSWWLNQPVWKMCSWNWIIPPIFGVNIKKMIELPPPSPYCWWTKSCTTWDVWNPINNGIFIISTGAGFLPSTVESTVCISGFFVSVPHMQRKFPEFSKAKIRQIEMLHVIDEPEQVMELESRKAARGTHTSRNEAGLS